MKIKQIVESGRSFRSSSNPNPEYWLPNSLNDAAADLIDNAKELASGEREYIGVIDLVPGWMKKISREVVVSYLLQLKKLSIDYETAEENVVDLRLQTTLETLEKFGLIRHSDTTTKERGRIKKRR